MQLDNHNDSNGAASKKVTAVAHANIALIKYWGKRSTELNLPAVGSISLTLDALKTETSVLFDEGLKVDRFKLNNRNISGGGLTACLRVFRPSV